MTELHNTDQIESLARDYVYDHCQPTQDSLGYALAWVHGYKKAQENLEAVIEKWAKDHWIPSPTHGDSFWQNQLILDLKRDCGIVDEKEKL